MPKLSKKGLLVLGVLVLSVGSAKAQDLRIIIFSVGQTDSQLIIGPNNKTLLVDVGAQVAGPKKQYEYVADKIESLTGRRSVDYFLISHYHYDHMGNLYYNSAKGNGLWGLLDTQGITIGTVVDRGDETPFPGETSSHQNYVGAVLHWKQQGKVTRRIKAELGTSQIQLGPNVTTEIVAVNGNGILQQLNALNPERFLDYPPSENDYSIALKVTAGKFEYFTGGDLSGETVEEVYPGGTTSSYNDIETTVAEKVGDVEVMKVDHHGSSHSSNAYFLSHLDPEVSLISSGTNGYKHPDKGVVARLLATSKVFITTDVSAEEWQGDGSIRDHIVGNDITITVHPGGETYDVNGTVMQAFSDSEEALGLDSQTGGGGEILLTENQTIPWEDAPNYLNRVVTVEGEIVRSKKRSDVAFLNFSSQYWRDFTGVIFANNFSMFPSNLSSAYNNKKVRIQGKITEYEGRPQIVISKPAQLTVVP